MTTPYLNTALKTPERSVNETRRALSAIALMSIAAIGNVFRVTAPKFFPFDNDGVAFKRNDAIDIKGELVEVRYNGVHIQSAKTNEEYFILFEDMKTASPA